MIGQPKKYKTVRIDDKVWLSENLTESRYNWESSNNALIPHVEDGATWSNLTIGARCGYLNDTLYVLRRPDPMDPTPVVEVIIDNVTGDEQEEEYYESEGGPLLPDGIYDFGDAEAECYEVESGRIVDTAVCEHYHDSRVYGYLYNSHTVMDDFARLVYEPTSATYKENHIDLISNSNSAPRQITSTRDWRVPTETEWSDMIDYITEESKYSGSYSKFNVAKILKSDRQVGHTTTTHPRWNYIEQNHIGTNELNFNMVPGGRRRNPGVYSDSDNNESGFHFGPGSSGSRQCSFFWTSTENYTYEPPSSGSWGDISGDLRRPVSAFIFGHIQTNYIEDDIYDWVATKQYRKDDLVIYNRNYYECIKWHNDKLPTNTKYWVLYEPSGSEYPMKMYGVRPWYPEGSAEITDLSPSLGASYDLKHSGYSVRLVRDYSPVLDGAFSCATTAHPRWDEHETHYGTNRFNFSLLPSGCRDFSGSYVNLGSIGYLWTSSSYSSSLGLYRFSRNTNGSFYRHWVNKTAGHSVRLVREATSPEAWLEDGSVIENAYQGNNAIYYDAVKIGPKPNEYGTPYIILNGNLKETHYSQVIVPEGDPTYYKAEFSFTGQLYSFPEMVLAIGAMSYLYIVVFTDEPLTENQKLGMSMGIPNYNNYSNKIWVESGASSLDYIQHYNFIENYFNTILPFYTNNSISTKCILDAKNLSDEYDFTVEYSNSTYVSYTITPFNSGTPEIKEPIATLSSDLLWSNDSTGAMTVYPHSLVSGISSDNQMINIYGRLYNWYAVNNPKSIVNSDISGGWRVPTDSEYSYISTYLSDTYSDITTSNSGNALKSCRQVNSQYEQDIPDGSYVASYTGNDGKVYPTVKIGNQVWLAKNLAETQYRDGQYIPRVVDQLDWAASLSCNKLGIGARCAYNNNNNWINDYGYLYNWYALSGGWRVPRARDWSELINYMEEKHPLLVAGWGTGRPLASCKMVNSPLSAECQTTIHPRWDYNETLYGVDYFGYSGLPGGRRLGTDGSFTELGTRGNWFYVGSSGDVFGISIHGNNKDLQYVSPFDEGDGMSLRLVRDARPDDPTGDGTRCADYIGND